MLFTEDRILAEVRRACEAIAAAFGVGAGALELVRDDLETLHRTLFGMPRDLTARIDPRSLAAMLAPQHREAARELLRMEAELLDRGGDPDGATIRRLQADAV